MTLKKPLLAATLVATVAMAGLSTRAEAGDPVLGALIGGGIGAAIGHDINRHGGGAVGGVLGAIVGSSIAADSGRYSYGGPRYYSSPAPVYYSSGPRYYYEPAPAYYAPPPVYYRPYGATIVYRDGYRGPHRGYYRDHRDYRGERHWR